MLGSKKQENKQCSIDENITTLDEWQEKTRIINSI